MRFSQTPNRQPMSHRLPTQLAGVTAHDGQRRESYETLAGREYDEGGRLRREWLATRHLSEAHRTLPPLRAGPSWYRRASMRLRVWLRDTVYVAGGLALLCGSIWAASVFLGLGGALIAFGVWCLIIGWSTGR